MVDTSEQIETWKKDPTTQAEYRRALEGASNASGSAVIQKDSQVQKFLRPHLTQHMQSQWKDKPELYKLIPDWAVGCRRPTPSTSYLEALVKPNVEVYTNGAERITAEGLILDGKLVKVDAIICATGFELKFLPQYKLVGRNGIDLEDQWYGDGRYPQAYMCIAMPNFPNYFSTSESTWS
jgi:cation diffusion facilitator CzcD-associated flavoprotein CzcO